MANRIVFNYTEIANAVEAIRSISSRFVEASDSFQSAMKSATDGWEGVSKDKFETFITGPIKKHMGTDIPTLVNGIATLLESNATSMSEADSEVGKNMPDSL